MRAAGVHSTPDSRDSLVGELNNAVHELRGALIEVISSLNADPTRPLSLGRALGVDKSLACKISKIATSGDLGTAVQQLPGSSAFNILVAALERREVRRRSLARLRCAIALINGIVTEHVGDRPTLELVVDGLTAEDRLLRSRKLAFRGNSGIWGVQAKARINTAILAPSADRKEFVDQAIIGGWIDFRRLRSDTRWALFRRRRFNTSADSPRIPAQPIDSDEPNDGPMLIREFCSATLPPIQIIHDPDGDIVHELGPSPVGNTGAFTSFFGSVVRDIGSRYADDPDDHGEFGAIISAPVERLQFDVLVHRDCRFALNAKLEVFGTLGKRYDRDRLPLHVSPIDLGSFPPVVDSPNVARYGQIIDHVMDRCGWDRREFIGARYIIDYPPFPSTAVITFPLEQRPV